MMVKKTKAFVHPYIPNSVPEIKAQMLKEIGVKDIEELYEDIPDSLRFKGEMNLPKPFLSEYGLERHVMGILGKKILSLLQQIKKSILLMDDHF